MWSPWIQTTVWGRHGAGTGWRGKEMRGEWGISIKIIKFKTIAYMII